MVKIKSKENGFSKQKYENHENKKKTFEIKFPRIILRNLSFKLNEEKLKTEMSKFGNVVEVSIPKHPDGKFKGYGFVKYSEMEEAAKAITELNNRNDKFHGTKVAVDWCLPRNIFVKNKDGNLGMSNPKEKKIEEKVENDKDDDDDEKSEHSDDDEDENDEHGDNDEDDDEDEDEDENSEEEEKNEDNDDDEEVNVKEETEEEKLKNKKKQEKLKQKAKVGTKDVVEKRTIFIRNISFNATEDDLKKVFEKFGVIKYCKLCMDRDFERPKGTGFIQFNDAKSALDACAESNIIEHDSRKLQIDLAISRQQATDLVTEKKTKEPQDNRNLSLAKEGVVYPNSYEAKGLTKSDLDKRAKIEAGNAAKLKLLHYFVSTTRLSVHNIPVKCSDQELKRIFLNALNENNDDEVINKKNSHKIVECRIMRDLARVNSEGIAKSKGFGFVEFSKFEDALKALRSTNNNPSLFEDKKTRLIVQFSIEDRRALQKKANRLDKQNKKINKEKNKKSKSNVKLNLIKSKLTKKIKKKRNDDSNDNNHNNNNNNNTEEDIEKKKEKNLIRTHLIEKKLNKRKAMEDEKKDKKAKKVKKNDEIKVKKVVNHEAREAALAERKKKRNQMKRIKAKNRVIKPQKIDSVDRLVDKYINEKTKIPTKKKWYE